MSTQGEAERRCRAWVASLGEVPEWQALLAQQAITLAALIDVEPNPVQAAAASREIRQIVGLLGSTARLGASPSPVPDRPESWSPPQVDTVGNIVDLVARKQQQGQTGA